MPSNKPYNDRALTEASDDALPKPQLKIIVDGNSVFKPSVKTYFVNEYDKDTEKYEAQVMGTYCSCDMVATTQTVCTCNTEAKSTATTKPACTCDSVASPTTPIPSVPTPGPTPVTTPNQTVCSCDSVCTCEAVCSCDGYQSCTCESYSSGGGGYVTCGSPCACVPVH